MVPVLPSGESSGRLVAALGGIAVASWLVAAVVLASRRKPRDAAWGASLLALAAVAGLLGMGQPGWHVVLIGMTAGIALRNAVMTPGSARWLTFAGLAAWIAAIAAARWMFAG